MAFSEFCGTKAPEYPVSVAVAMQPLTADVLLIPDLHCTTEMFADWFPVFHKFNLSILPFSYLEICTDTPTSISFQDCVAHVSRTIEWHGALKRRLVVIGHGVGGLIAYAAAQRSVTDVLVLITPMLPKGYIRVFHHDWRSSWYALRAQLAYTRKRLVAPPTSRKIPVLKHVFVPSANECLKKMEAAPPILVRESLEGVPLPITAILGDHVLIAGAISDELHPVKETGRFAQHIGAKFEPFYGGRALPINASSALCANCVGVFVQQSLRRPRYLRMVS